MAAVSAARAAIDNLTRAVALELARDAIAVNAVAIGLVDTPRQRRRHRDERADQPYETWLVREADRRQVPMRRAAVPEEVARVIVFAHSPTLSYTPGVEVGADRDAAFLVGGVDQAVEAFRRVAGHQEPDVVDLLRCRSKLTYPDPAIIPRARSDETLIGNSPSVGRPC